ncbi:unnamed protein product [Cunninghamella blakesleeana]
MPKHDNSASPLLNLSAGAISGMVACITLQPFDLIKTRLQQEHQQRLDLAREAKLKRIIVSPHNSTIYSTIRAVVKNNGITGLWRGTVPTILRNVPGSAMYFYALAQTRETLARTRHIWQPLISKNSNSLEQKQWENLVSGMFARGGVGYIMMPVTVLKVRYESNLYNYKTLSEAFTSIIKHDGIRGLFAGYGATFIRDAPFAGIYLFFYENCKKKANVWTTANNYNVASYAINLSSGVIAGLTASVITHPFDMLKTRMQLKPTVYKHVLQAAKKVLKEEGAKGFFDGISVRILRKPLSSAISWTIYEEVIRWYSHSQSLQNRL